MAGDTSGPVSMTPPPSSAPSPKEEPELTCPVDGGRQGTPALPKCWACPGRAQHQGKDRARVGAQGAPQGHGGPPGRHSFRELRGRGGEG